ncbi:Protein_tyrosine phosphatase-like protein [Hexamita inflata]|uniref:very-long-chain (3R)-3-hydroxyacyl-CoA dehydratase n=1 Tax=Hexamita inflata TaxID=28002 RepID=A0ABP1ISN5_9EUKA
MILDILHVILHLVNGKLLATTIQILGRGYVAWVILPYQLRQLDYNNSVIRLFVAWAIADIVRYGFYLKKQSKLFKWLRYSCFIILYPIGVFGGELPLIYAHYSTTKKSGELFLMLTYVPLFPYMYIHMIKQRVKNLSQKKIQKISK